jgi:uncharacterized protein (DUF433 family)
MAAMVNTELHGERHTAAKRIVRQPGVLGGRWHFEGTQLAVADVRADHAAYASQDGPYHFAGLSQADVEAALAFEFPSTRDTAVQVEYMAVTVHCTCGEDTHKAMIGPSHSVECDCGRTWRITVFGDEAST